MNEHDIQNQLMINISKNPNLTPFRVNVGTGWAGIPSKNRDGTMTLKNPRPFRTGVPKGFPDVFVLNKRKITPEDVGKEFCEFMFLEVKTEDGNLSEDQIAFIDFLTNQKSARGIVSHGVEEGTEFFKNSGSYEQKPS